MDTWTNIRALTLVLVAAIGLVQVLRALAIRVRNETAMHDLKVRVSQLQEKRYRATMLRHGISPGSRTTDDIIEVGETLEEAQSVPVPPSDEAESNEQERRAA